MPLWQKIYPVLPGEAFGRGDRPLLVAVGAIGAKYLVALDGGAAGGNAEAGQDAAQPIGGIEDRPASILAAQQPPSV